MIPGEYYNLDSSVPLATKLFAPLGQVSGFLNILMSCLLKGSHLCQKMMSCEWPLNEEILEWYKRELLQVFILSIGASELRDVHTLWNSPAMNSSRMWYFSEICENHRIRISQNSHGFWNAVAQILPSIYGQSFFYVVSLIPSAI